MFGIIDGKTDISKIYKYTDRHLRAWFPKLPSYEAYVQRLNKVSEVFAPVLALIFSIMIFMLIKHLNFLTK